MGIFLAQDNKLVRSLIQNAKLGNNASFEQLVKLHIEQVYAICLRLLANIKEAEEITKKVFLQTWQQIAYIREDASFGLWLTGITVYNSLEFLRNKKGKNKTEKINQMPYKSDSSDILLLDNAILTLPDDERVMFVLHKILKYTPDEIADMMFKKQEEVDEILKKNGLKLSKLGGIESITIPFEERINLLPNKILPEHDIWNNIFKELLQLRAKSPGLTDTQVEELEETSEKKKGFRWFRKK